MNQTRLGISTQVPDLDGMTAGGRVEMDFYGSGGAENTPNPRLYKGYIELSWPTFQILAGQDWDTFSALYPTTINFGYLGAAGNLQYRRPQIRLTRFFPLPGSSRILLAAAAARSISGEMDGFGKNDGDDAGVPTWQGRLAWESVPVGGAPFLVGVSGHFGKQEVDWDLPGSDSRYTSWSANAELSVPLGSRISFKGELFMGADLDAYYGGVFQGINRTTRRAIRARGGWGELTLVPFSGTAIHVGAGVDRPREGDLNPGDRRQNFSAFANLYHDITTYLTVAFEYSRWRTDYVGAPKATDNRYHAALLMNF
jgi:hypothetical protein